VSRIRRSTANWNGSEAHYIVTCFNFEKNARKENRGNNFTAK